MEITEVLAKFENPKKSGNGYQVRCPAHEDRVASLSISNGGGKILLCCQAKCSTEAVVAALGLRMADLFSQPLPQRIAGVPDKIGGSPVVAVYEYQNANGTPAYRILKTANKDFRQQRFENGEWIWKGPETKLLFRLPELIADDSEQPVFIPEGEKDVLTLLGWGLQATTNSGGAEKFGQDNEALRGRTVVILPDNHETGWKHGYQVEKKLTGIAGKIITIRLPDVPEKGDITKWKELGHTKDELLALVDDALKGPKPDISRFIQSDTLLRPDELSPMGLAAKFFETYYRETRYVEVRGTFHNYEFGRWRESRCHAEVKCKRVINELHDKVKDAEKRFEDLLIKRKSGDPTVSEALAKLSAYLEPAQKFLATTKQPKMMSSILDFSRSDLLIEADDFDPDLGLLNLKNGSLELETGKFREHRASDLCSMRSPVEYDPKAECPRWIRFLTEIFLNDMDLVHFMQRAIGYSISGYTSEQVMLILHGDGSNGKSELLDILDQLMGTYLKSANVDTFMDDRPNGGHNEDIARLRGARLVTTSETEKSKRLAEGLVKRLTGGDLITASYKHQRTFQFIPRFKIWLAANHKPQINNTDFGIWRRILLIPFGAKFVKPGVALGEKQFRIDPTLKADLRKELPGILNWAAQGFRLWRDEGLNAPEVVKAASEAYRVESDKLGTFLEDCMMEGADYVADFGNVYEAYTKWCEDSGLKPQSKINLSKDMTSRGMEFKRIGVRRATTLLGWGLQD